MTDSKKIARKPRKKVGDSDLTLDEQTLLNISEHKRKIAVLTDEVAAMQDALIERWVEGDITGIAVTHGGERISGTLVQGERVHTDESKLAKKVGAQQWKKLLTPVLDKTKLADAIKAGLVSPVDVADASEVKPSKPFIKVTRK